MTRSLPLFALASAAVVIGGAKGDESAVFLLLYGLAVAFFVTLGLPAALLLHSMRPDWIAKEARAFDRRKTACVLIGAGVVLVAIVVVGGVAARHPLRGLALFMPTLAWFFVGFAGCARRQGERLTGTADGPRPLVVGWLARAGAFAVPVLWPFVGAYLVVAAFGVPVVAMIDRRNVETSTTVD